MSQSTIPAPKTPERQKAKPTWPIFVLLFGVNSWMITVAFHFIGAASPNGPGSFKYFVNLGVAVLSALFMKFYGKRLVQETFGNQGGRNLEVTPMQAVGVVLFLIANAGYLLWLIA